jgi:cytoskeletal protein CcmA (bactofilin family)
MALFGRDRDGGERTDGATVAGIGDVAAREGDGVMVERNQSTGAGGMDAFLGKGTKISGKLVFDGQGRIEGQVDGEIAAKDVLTVGGGAVVNAKIAGTTVVIEGHVTGDVTASQRLELRASARVHGNVTTPSLVVQEGAVLNGQCSMTAGEPRTTREKPVVETRTPEPTRDAAVRVA